MVVSSNNNYLSIREQILIEFEHISDFVWKSHNLIVKEKDAERVEKMIKDYFTKTGFKGKIIKE